MANTDDLALRQKQKLKDFVEQKLLSKHSKRELSILLDLTESAIALWLNTDSKINVQNIPLSTVLKFCEVSGFTLDKLAEQLELFPKDKEHLTLRVEYKQRRFRQLIKDISVGKNQAEVARILKITPGTVTRWSGSAWVDPEKVPLSTLATLAAIKDCSLEELIIWLGVKKEKIPLASFTQAQEIIESLSKKEQGQLMAWLAQRLTDGLSSNS